MRAVVRERRVAAGLYVYARVDEITRLLSRWMRALYIGINVDYMIA